MSIRTCLLALLCFTVSTTAFADDYAADGSGTSTSSAGSRRPVRADRNASAEEPDEKRLAPVEEVELVRPERRTSPERQAPASGVPAGDAAPGDSFGSRRIQVFLVPMGSTATLAAGAVQTALESEVRRLPGFTPVDLVEALAVPPKPADAQSMARARQSVASGDELMRKHDYGEAVERYKRAIRLMDESNEALDNWSYADAFTRLGVAFTLVGEARKGHECFLMAARVDLLEQIDGAAIDGKVGGRLGTARAEVSAGATGALSVLTSIPGARVFLGGVYKGTTPVTIDRAPVGLNHVRLDRPGAFPVVSIVEVKEAFDTPLKVKLSFTPEALELQRTLQQVPRSLDRQTGVPDMVSGLGTRFRLERAVVSTVQMAQTNVAKIRVAVFDMPRQSRLVDETVSLAVDIEGGLEDAVRKWVRDVFDKADGARDRSAVDPLDRTDGTEEWYTGSESRKKSIDARTADVDDENVPPWERSNYKPETYRSKSTGSSDPLDHGDGTEDW